MFYQAYVFIIFFILLFRTLSDKTAKPIIAKLEHKMYT